MRATEQDKSRSKYGTVSSGVPKLLRQACPNLREKLYFILLVTGPRCHDEWMALRQRPRADRRDPKIYILSRLDIERFPKIDLKVYCVSLTFDGGSCGGETKEVISVQYTYRLNYGRYDEQSSWDFHVKAG